MNRTMNPRNISDVPVKNSSNTPMITPLSIY
jgi:hypothetical protein